MSRASARPAVRVSAQEDDEVALLEKALSMAKERIVKAKEAAKAAPAAAAGGDGGYAGAAFTVKTFNAISPVGLKRFPSGKYAVAGELNQLPSSPMAIMLRSHNLKPEEVAPTVRCIVRCGAGTNNIPVPKMTELGIPVFNTPGANANAVKELVVCSLLLASRGIVEGNAHVNNVINKEENVSMEAASPCILWLIQIMLVCKYRYISVGSLQSCRSGMGLIPAVCRPCVAPGGGERAF